MTITPEQRENILKQIEQAQLSPAAHSRIVEIVNQPSISFEEEEEIQKLIESDIEADVNSIPGLAAEIMSDADFQALVAQNEKEITAIEDDLADSMKTVDSEGKKLDQMTEGLEKVMTEARIDSLKQKLSS
jgi:uncharacterized coiled-coil protein SlyX